MGSSINNKSTTAPPIISFHQAVPNTSAPPLSMRSVPANVALTVGRSLTSWTEIHWFGRVYPGSAILRPMFCFLSASGVGIATILRNGWTGFRIPIRVRSFNFPLNVRTIYKAYPSSCSIGTGFIFTSE